MAAAGVCAKSFFRQNTTISALIKRSSGFRPGKKVDPSLIRFRACSNSVVSGKADEPSTFEKMIRERRHRARKSVLFHIYSKHLISGLTDYCKNHGEIAHAFHYSIRSEEDFVFVEFKREQDVQSLLSDARHFAAQSVIPVHSRCLWFQETGSSQNEPAGSLRHDAAAAGSLLETKLIQSLQEAETVEEQMLRLYEQLKLAELGQQLRFFICHQLEQAFSGMLTSVVLPFGSTVNGFGKFNCDLDMVLSITDTHERPSPSSKLFYHTKRALIDERSQSQQHLRALSDVIDKFFPGCSNVQRILQARVPIVKFHHELVDTDCDLSMGNLSGVYMSELLFLYGEFDYRVRALGFTVLRWAKHSGLTHSHPGNWITNFSIILMVVFFLQTRPKPLLPTLERLQSLAGEGDRRAFSETDCTFLRDITKFPQTDNKEELADLLMEFFAYYVNFDFSRGISIVDGSSFIRPDYAQLYIRNPLESELNVSRNVSSEELHRLRDVMRSALWQLETSTGRRESHSWGILTLLDVRVQNDEANTRPFRVSSLFDQKKNSNTVLSNANGKKAMANLGKMSLHKLSLGKSSFTSNNGKKVAKDVKRISNNAKSVNNRSSNKKTYKHSKNNSPDWPL